MMMATQHRLLDFVKTVLLKIFVSPYATVCEMYCGKVADVEKWDEAQIGHYIGIDVATSGVNEVKEAWESQRKAYTSEFIELDPCIEDIGSYWKDKEKQADIVFCMHNLHVCFDSEEKARRLLHNVSSLLRPGGYFLGITPDSSTIWAKYQKNVEAYHNRSGGMKPSIVPNCIRSENYMITFEVEEEKFPFFGKKYQLKFASDVSAETQCLVHFPSLLRFMQQYPVSSYNQFSCFLVPSPHPISLSISRLSPLPCKDRGKVYVHPTLPRPHLRDYIGYVVVVVE